MGWSGRSGCSSARPKQPASRICKAARPVLPLKGHRAGRRMRGLIATGVIVSALAATSAAAQTSGGAAGRWIEVGTDADSILSYDPASVSRRGTIVEYRLRAVMRPELAGEMRSVTARGRLDCGAQTDVYWDFQRFDAAGQPMAPLPARTMSPEPILRGSLQQRFYERLCPVSLQRPLPPSVPLMIVPSPRPPAPRPPIAPPAPPAPPAPTRVRPAQWRVPPSSLITSNDYPAPSIRAEEEGRTEVRLFVSTAGRVQRCAVLVSSGFERLDAATCRVLTERARFTPARNERGRRAVGMVTAGITWRLPD